jgi:hypothetical protein
VQSDAEHQQDHADLGQFLREPGVAHESGCERSDRDAREQVAQQWRQPQARGHEAECHREDEADRDQGYELRFVGHPLTSCAGSFCALLVGPGMIASMVRSHNAPDGIFRAAAAL